MTDFVEIRKYSGVSTFMSKEDRPIEVLQSARNLRFNHKLGRLVKRAPYANILTSGLTSLKRMIEFKNKNSQQLLMLMDGNTLKESVYSGGSYGAIGSITNDKRTSGSTIDGDNFHPIIVNEELRSGAGGSANTQRPVWYGHIPERNRFNSAQTISAGRYLCDQYYNLGYTGLFGSGSDVTGGTGSLSEKGLVAGNYIVYACPVLDGYQVGFPEALGVFNNTAADGYITIILNTNGGLGNTAQPRVTDFDLFVGTLEKYDRKTGVKYILAYYLERISLNDDSDYFFEKAGTGNNGNSKITINDFADWRTFDGEGMFVYDVTNGSYHRITAEADNGANLEYTVTPAPTTGAATYRLLSRWYGSTGNYTYYTFYDNYYKKLGSEMYLYLNMPAGDLGLFDLSSGFNDFFYKYSANNGVSSLYGGMWNNYTSDPLSNYTFLSVPGSPDIVPSQNIFRHKADVRGIVAIGKDFLVFTDVGVERIAYTGIGSIDQNDEYMDAVLVHHKAITKISDNEIAFMSYKGAHIIADRRVIYVGKHLKDWFIGQNALLSQTQKEACVAHYNDENSELWFSFPTYTTTPYTTGLIMVFDIDAYRGEDLSAWWFAQTNVALLAFETNSERHMLAGGATKIVDMDGNGTDETVATSHKLKLLQNVIPNRLVRFGWLHVDASTSDTVSVSLYFDGSETAVSLTLNSDLRGLIAYVKKTLEIEITTSASVNEVEYLGTVLEFQPKRVA